MKNSGEPVVPDFEIPYHTDIMERFDGIDLDAKREKLQEMDFITSWEISHVFTLL